MAIGLTLGAGMIIFILVPLVEGQIYGISAYDPRVLLVSTLALIAIGLLATIVPASRAVGITPSEALRYE